MFCRLGPFGSSSSQSLGPFGSARSQSCHVFSFITSKTRIWTLTRECVVCVVWVVCTVVPDSERGSVAGGTSSKGEAAPWPLLAQALMAVQPTRWRDGFDIAGGQAGGFVRRPKFHTEWE